MNEYQNIFYGVLKAKLIDEDIKRMEQQGIDDKEIIKTIVDNNKLGIYDLSKKQVLQ